MEILHQTRILAGLAIGELEAHDTAVRAGHWDGGRTVSEAAVVLASRVGELPLEASTLQKLKSANISDHNALEEKLADLIILTLDISGAYHLDVASAVVAKMLYNEAKSKLGKDAKL